MNLFLTLAYLFFIGSVLGWVLELFYRRFISGANPERKWINPGFCVGPYVPLYGFGLCILFVLAYIGDAHEVNTTGGKLLMFLGMAVSMNFRDTIPAMYSMAVGQRGILFSGTPLHSECTAVAVGESGVFFCHRILLRRVHHRRGLLRTPGHPHP